MIDFVKVILPNQYCCSLNGNSNLSFETSICERTGEVLKRIAYYKNLRFDFKPNCVILSGSLHKYWNNGEHNHNDFNLEALKKSLNEVSELFEINLTDAKLQNLEFGVNISPQRQCKAILRSLFFHTGKPPKEYKRESVRHGFYKQVQRTRFYLKCYDKGAQYESILTHRKQILRWEIKVVKMLEIQLAEIHSLNDLLNLKSEQLLYLGNTLLKRWEETLLFENRTNRTLIKGVKQKKWSEWSSLLYWMELYDKTRLKNKNGFAREVKKYKKTITNLENSDNENIASLIAEKWGVLTGCEI